MDEVTTPATHVGTTDVSRRHLLEQFAERLQRRGVHNPDVAAVVSAARAEAFVEDLRSLSDPVNAASDRVS